MRSRPGEMTMGKSGSSTRQLYATGVGPFSMMEGAVDPDICRYNNQNGDER